jgi:glycosyltransferase involved in cell wall biosynthesis
VLILDDAVSFGGSIVSAANLVRALHPTRYRVVFCTAASEALVRDRLQEAAAACPVYLARKTLDYARLESFRCRLQALRNPMAKRFLVYVLQAVRLLANLPYMLRVANVIVRHRVDLVQFNNAFGNDEGSLVTALLRKRVIVFFRGYDCMGVLDRALVLDRSRAFVAVSEHVKAIAVSDGVPAERIRVATPPAIAVALDPDVRARTRRRYGIPPEGPVVGFFGRIVEWKGQLEFIRAAALVAAKVPRASFLIVGDAGDGTRDYEGQVRAAVASSGIEGQVFFTGYVDDVDAHYRAVDVVAHASIAPEPSGRVIFEAMDHGIPVVASDRGGPKEFIEDGVDGFIVDPTDAARFAGRLVELLTNDERRMQMGERARTKIQNSYGKEQYAAAVMAAYDTCLAPPAHTAGTRGTGVTSPSKS